MRLYFALVLLSLTLVSFAAARRKPKSMSIRMMQLEGCGASFDVQQEPNPFLTNVEEVKEKGVVKFRRDKETLENFPDEIRLRILHRSPSYGFFETTVPAKTSKPCSPVDPRNVRFKALWSNKSRSVSADGIVLDQQYLGPEPFCELKCANRWTYELRIDSKVYPSPTIC